MEYKNIIIEKIKLNEPYINKDQNLEIPVLYDNNELFIKIPEKYNEYFNLEYENNNVFFNYSMKLNRISIDDGIKIEDIINGKELSKQKETSLFFEFILKLKNHIMKLFFNEIKINNNYLNKINLKMLDLENHEIDRAIWNENIDFSLISELIEEKEKIEELKYETDDEFDDNLNIKGLENFVFINIFYFNKITKNPNNLTLKCSVIFINKKIEDKKHIYVNWTV